MPLIPVGLKYDVTLTGRVPKLVRCEQCGHEYVYLLEGTAAGHGSSPLFLDNEGARNRAYETAHVFLDATLRDDCAVVPCARCGHVQAHMLPKARQQYRRWMFTAGLYLLALGGIVAAPAIVLALIDDGARAGDFITLMLATAAAVLIAGGLALAYTRLLLARGHDPNALPVEVRKQWGDDLSVSKDEYLKMLPSSS